MATLLHATIDLKILKILAGLCSRASRSECYLVEESRHSHRLSGAGAQLFV